MSAEDLKTYGADVPQEILAEFAMRFVNGDSPWDFVFHSDGYGRCLRYHIHDTDEGCYI